MTLGLAAVGGPQEAANVGRVVLVLQGIGEYDFVPSEDYLPFPSLLRRWHSPACLVSSLGVDSFDRKPT